MMRYGAAAVASSEQQASSVRELVGSDDAMALVVAMLGPYGARSCAEALLLARMVPGVRFWGEDVRLLPSATDWMSSVRASFGAKLLGFEAMPRDWITQAVRDWYEQEQWSRAMLLVGEAGTGKSVVAATLALHGSDLVVVGAAHCFDAADPDTCDLRKAYASIAGQLAATVPGLAEHMQGLNEDAVSLHRLSRNEVFDRFIAKPCQALASALAPDHRVVIVLDGIDECDDEHCADLLFLLETSFLANWLGFVATSRPGVTWRESFRPTLLEVDEQRTMEDVRGFLQTRLAALLPGVDVADTVEELAKRSSGNGGLLHARFAVDKVASLNPTALTDVPSFPSSMADVCTQAFSSFKAEVLGGSEELYKHVFAPLVAARSPVPLSLLGEPVRKHVRRAHNLLLVDSDGRVRFVHRRSMADWLTSSIAADQGLAVKVEDGNDILVELCLENPTNRFALRHALFHLCSTGREQEAAGLLLDVSWLLQALQDKGVDLADLVADGGSILGQKHEWQEAADVLRVLEKGTKALRRDPRELASQLFGRLEAGHAALRGVVEHYKVLGLSWLKPVRSSLEPARSMLPKTHVGHLSYVTAVAYCHELDMIASGSGGCGSGGNTVKVWKASTGEQLRTLEGHSGAEVRSVVVGGERDMIASGSCDSTVNIWKASTGELLRTLDWHSGEVIGLAVAAQLDMIVIATASSSVKVCAASTGELLRTLEGHSAEVTSVAVAAELDMIVSGSFDQTVKVWKASMGKLLLTLKGHWGWLTSVAVAAELDVILSGSDDKTVKVWKASTGELLRTLEGHSDRVANMVIVAELGIIVSTDWNCKSLLWDVVTGKPVTRDAVPASRHNKLLIRDGCFRAYLAGCTVGFSADVRAHLSAAEHKVVVLGDAGAGVHILELIN